MDENIIKIESLTIKDSDEAYLVNDISFELNGGECLGIVGESGSGKTLTAKAVLQCVPENLKVLCKENSFLGQDLEKLPLGERKKLLGANVGFVPQNTVEYLHPLIKIKDQICDGYLTHFSVSKKEAQKKAQELLLQVGISDVKRVMNSYAGELSGGMRQRVNIAMALMCDPKVIVADEPTTALDCVVQLQVIELFNKINKERHVAMIMISHDLNLIKKYCDRIVVMYAGQIVESGSSEKIFNKPNHPYTKALISVIPHINNCDRLSEIPGCVPDKGREIKECIFKNRCKFNNESCSGEVSTYKIDGCVVRCNRAKEKNAE